ncbi:MAG: DUF4917 family protein [Anaerolineales bacterium]|nr:MAG: DUF4917 family protein [Anaerolineales bacterium]
MTWEEIAGNGWEGILIGNGASIAVSDRFSYSSIFERARSELIKDPLNEDDIKLFESFNSYNNFEQVLHLLSIAQQVNMIHHIEQASLSASYDRIKQALIQAVHSVHIPWDRVWQEIFEAIRAALFEYNDIFSTNYDLLTYWSIMQQEGEGFTDFFREQRFDSLRASAPDGLKAVLYLHGGLHLYRTRLGGTLKRRNEGGYTLLELFGRPFNGAEPLFVSEGNAQQKIETIASSDYLTFAHQKFSQFNKSLVIFGQSLSESDKHIIDAICSWGNPTLAVSIFPRSNEDTLNKKAYYCGLFPHANVSFFDSTTHPLGSADLKATTSREMHF